MKKQYIGGILGHVSCFSGRALGHLNLSVWGEKKINIKLRINFYISVNIFKIIFPNIADSCPYHKARFKIILFNKLKFIIKYFTFSLA